MELWSTPASAPLIQPCARPTGATVTTLFKPGGWLLGLFFCHSRPGGPPFGSDPLALAEAWRDTGLVEQIWQPAASSLSKRSDEWLGLWRKQETSASVAKQEVP